jgi:predicted permease
VQQLLTETILLSILGGALGVLVAQGLIGLVRRWPWPGILRLEQTSLDLPALMLAMMASIGAGVLCGISPALRLSRRDLHDALKAGGRVAGTRDGTRTRNVLVIAQVALAVVLLAGAGLLLQSFWRLVHVPLGFNPQQVLAMSLRLPRSDNQPVQQVQFADRLLERLKSMPGVEAVAVSSAFPLTGVTDVGIRFEARPSDLSTTTANYYRVTPGYFRVMQIPLIRGRLITEQDTPSSPPVVVINETMARRFFPDEDPVGKRLDVTGVTYMRQIVGIVGDVKQENLRTPTPPQVYEPFAQQPGLILKVLLRAPGDPLRFTATVRHEVRAIDNTQAVSTAELMEDIVARSLTRDRFSVFILGGFAGVALILAAVGLYALVAYFVTQRTNEIAVRIALGAEASGIQRLVIFQSLRVVLIGVCLGDIGAAIFSGVLRSLLYEVKPRDPLTFAGITILLLAVALVAAFIPSRRAARVDPVMAMRAE